MSVEEGPESLMRKKIKASANTFISALQDREKKTQLTLLDL